MARPNDTQEPRPRKTLRERLSDQSISLAVALLALLLAVPGSAVVGAYAATKFTGRDIKNGTIRAVDLARGAVRARAIAKGQVKASAIGRGEVRAANIGADQVTAAAIGRDQVTADAIGTNQVTADAIAPNQVGTEQIAPDSVGSREVAPGAIGSSAIANGSVQSSDIGSGQVGSGEIANGQIRSADIGAGEITPGNVSMPAPQTLSIPAGQPATVTPTLDYVHVATFGNYEKQVAESALEATWTGATAAGFRPCVFQLRVDGAPGAGLGGEVYVNNGTSAVSVSSTALFTGIPAGAHTVEVWARIPDFRGGDYPCTVGPAETGIGQTVVLSEKVI